MRNIYELEKKWLKYKVKNSIPHILLLLMAIISTMLIITFTSKTLTNKTKLPLPQPKKVQKIEKVENNSTKKQPVHQVKAKPVIKQKEEKIVLTPSFDFIKNLHSNSHPSYEERIFSQAKKKQKKPKKVQKQKKQKQVIQRKKEIKPEKPKEILIKRQETQEDINHVVQRFQKNNNPALSLFVAKKYYKLGNYRQAYNYALITNQINQNIDQSWIIFAKSLVKLGKKDKAIETLQQYIYSSQSANAKVLLDDIQSGKFK